jgi:protoheme IX farnesyltransferase
VLAAASAGASLSIGTMVSGLVGMLMIACSGNAMNMYLERHSDFLMPRTSKRPLPAQELTTEEVVTFAAITFGVAIAFLFGGVNWQTGVCGVLNWILYVFIYTPLKRYTPLNTEVGAVAGAMPVLMGSLAATGTIELVGWAFFGVLFLWQFPHFFAIAWMYRDQYEVGGLKMLTNTEPTGRSAGIKSVVGCGLLIIVSLLPMVDLIASVETSGWWRTVAFAIVSLCLGGVYMKASIRFLKKRETTVARRLLRSSLLYLPLYMLILCLVYLI